MVNRKNIFLDFLSPDNWKTYITVSNNSMSLLPTLCRSINYAVFLTSDYCIIPPAFMMQSALVRKAMHVNSLFLEERLILFPLKEHNLEQYFLKKEQEYVPVKATHKGFYDSKSKTFIEKNRNAVMPRKSEMGLTIAESWQKVSDSSPLWAPINVAFPKISDEIRVAPSILKDRGNSVTLEAVKSIFGIQDTRNDFIINQAIQHDYLKAYLLEYNCEIIRNIPPKPIGVDYLVGSKNIFYDYRLIKSVFELIGIGEIIDNANADLIISLKKTPEFHAFIQILNNLCKSNIGQNEIKNQFSFICLDKYKSLRKKSFLTTDYRKTVNIFNAIADYFQYTCATTTKNIKGSRIMLVKQKVFIVHGHDNEAKEETARFLEKLDLDAIILHEQPDKGKTIIEKLEEYTDVDFAIILYTPCDEGKSKKEDTYRDRARQNVIFEHGYLVNKLGREKVCALVKGDTEQPSDLSGVIYKKMDSAGAWKTEVAKALKAAGVNVDLNKLFLFC